MQKVTIVRLQSANAGLPQKLQNQIPGLSRTFPGLCKVFLQDLKFNFHYYSFMQPLFALVTEENFNATHLDFYY